MEQSAKNQVIAFTIGFAIAVSVTILGSGAIGLGLAAGLIGGVTAHGIIDAITAEEIELDQGIYESLTEIRSIQEEKIKKEKRK